MCARRGQRMGASRVEAKLQAPVTRDPLSALSTALHTPATAQEQHGTAMTLPCVMADKEGSTPPQSARPSPLPHRDEGGADRPRRGSPTLTTSGSGGEAAVGRSSRAPTPRIYLNGDHFPAGWRSGAGRRGAGRLQHAGPDRDRWAAAGRGWPHSTPSGSARAEETAEIAAALSRAQSSLGRRLACG